MSQEDTEGNVKREKERKLRKEGTVRYNEINKYMHISGWMDICTDR